MASFFRVEVEVTQETNRKHAGFVLGIHFHTEEGGDIYSETSVILYGFINPGRPNSLRCSLYVMKAHGANW
jgi:hypothetical protein